jgi:hypothetical protein
MTDMDSAPSANTSVPESPISEKIEVTQLFILDNELAIKLSVSRTVRITGTNEVQNTYSVLVFQGREAHAKDIMRLDSTQQPFTVSQLHRHIDALVTDKDMAGWLKVRVTAQHLQLFVQKISL